MQIHELEAFVRAYESGSFTAAAQAGYVTRQAQSKTIAHLEAEVGPLFVRQARGIVPTPLARAMYPHAQRMLAEYVAIAAEAKRYNDGMLGALTLACDPGAMVTFPPNMLAKYRATHPGIELIYTLERETVAAQSLAAHKVDAVISCPLQLDGTVFDVVQCCELAVVLARNAMTDADLKAASLTEQGGYIAPVSVLHNMPVFGISQNNYVERHVLPFLQAQGVVPRMVYDLGDTAIMRNEMEMGLGGIFVELHSAQNNFFGPDYVVVPLTGPHAPMWQTGITYYAEEKAATLAANLASFMRGFIA